MHHFLITRNNYEDNYPYLEERIAKFRNITLPSLHKQTSKQFTWILTGNKGLDVKEFDGLNFIITNTWLDYVTKAIKPGELVITTRLDNDDYIAPEFVSTIQKRALHSKFMKKDIFIIDSGGIRYDQRYSSFYKDTYYSSSRCSPFLSVVEKKHDDAKLMGCFFAQHNNMHLHFPVDFKDDYLWVQIIHYTNKLMSTYDQDILLKRGIMIDSNQLGEVVGLDLYKLAQCWG